MIRVQFCLTGPKSAGFRDCATGDFARIGGSLSLVPENVKQEPK